MICAGFVSGIQSRPSLALLEMPITLGPRATKAQGFLQGTETAERRGEGNSGTAGNDTFGKRNTGCCQLH